MKKFILEQQEYEYEEWESVETTFTFEEAKLIYENHHLRHDYRWRILEVHTLG